MAKIFIEILASALILSSALAAHRSNATDVYANDKCPNLCHCDPKLRTAKCRNIQKIPSFPNYVRRLVVRENRFPTITKALLKPLASLNLTHLTIEYSVIHLDDDCFDYLRYLENLDLSSNDKLNIVSLKRSFSSLQLQSLDTLRFIGMEWNSTHLLKCPFSNLGKKIEQLSLNYNYFDRLPSGSMNGLENLVELSLTFNYLKICDETFKDLHSLTKLDLSFNSLERCEIENLPRTLKHLNFRRNKLGKFPTFCMNNSTPLLKDLRSLVLDFNLITAFRSEHTSCFPSLQNLSLQGNNIIHFSSTLFTKLPSLRSLYLNGMKRTTLIVGKEAFSIPSLRIFCFQNNRYPFKTTISSRRTTLRNSTFLQYLDLSHNQLPSTAEDLNYLMKGLYNLKKLRFINVGWKGIPDSLFKLLPSIEEVYLSHNSIASLNSSIFTETSKIKYLYLDDNKIIHIGPTTFTKSLWNTIRLLDLSGNPFACNCGLLWFRHKLRNPKNITFLDYPSNYECLSPQERMGLQLARFNLSAEECKTKSELVIILVSAVSICMFALIFSAIVYKGRWHLRYWVYLLHYRRSQHNDLRSGEYKYDAFIVYAEEDNDYVHNTLLPKLEAENGYKLCIHYRDFVAGKIISDNIAECMADSRHVIVIVSRNFCKSKWCRFELIIAQDRWLNNESEAPVLAMLEEVNCRNMTREMRALVKTTTYALWTENEHGQTLFWEQLLSALKK